jgi:hypothetical protein
MHLYPAVTFYCAKTIDLLKLGLFGLLSNSCHLPIGKNASLVLTNPAADT